MSGVNCVVGIKSCRFTPFASISTTEVKAHLLVSIGRSGEGQLAHQMCDMKRRSRTSDGINPGNTTR